MNTIKDVEKIVIELTDLMNYHALAKKNMKPFEWRQTAKEAMSHVTEIEEQLASLKLSAEDRKHFSKLREAVSDLKTAMKWESRGNSLIAMAALGKGLKAVVEYQRRKNFK